VDSHTGSRFSRWRQRPQRSLIAVWTLFLLAFSVSLPSQEPGAAGDAPEGTDSDFNSLGELTAGYQALETGEYEVALRHYRLALDKATNSTFRFQADFGIGSTLTAMGRHQEAVVALEEALRIRPDHAEALYMLGLAYAYADDMDKAVATLEMAVSRAPDLAAAHHGLSLLYAQLGWYQQAAASCREVLEIDADHVEAKSALAPID
jgi:tetratricopeptide (TPR) repeat protein